MIPMRSATIIFAASLLICIIFLSSPNSGNYSQADNILNNKGRVLGAQEVIAEISLKDLGIDLNALPESEDEVIKEPEKINAQDYYGLQNCRGAAIDVASGKILFSKGADEAVPIASITKLAAALVFLDYNPGWDKIYTVKNSDIIAGGKVYLNPGDRVKVKDLLYLSLIGSANSAAKALVSACSLSEAEFVDKMNLKAKDLGLINTRFADPVGLSRANISTALEVVKLVRAALAEDEISRAASQKNYEFFLENGKKRSISSTDLLLFRFPYNGIEILGGKTGFTKLAGYCFTGKFKDSSGHEIISAILGSDDQNSRFTETKGLVSWVYDNYKWQ